ncbi:MAG TPA: carboxymuconolactone decarboxylase family protein [Mycobacteriales bacterium]|nr:carboxymuconolactone decarboxylase family protein [Mycobacteriales bacterium]
MALDTLKDALPPYAKDLRLNLSSVIGTSKLPGQQLWGAVLAVAVAVRSPRVLAELGPEARARLTPKAYDAALGAAAVMSMNNVYYRTVHLIGDEAYATLPARLRMSVIGSPGVDRVDFELWCLAVSAVNGCGRCLESHEQELRGKGVPRESVQEAVRVAAVLNAVAVTLDAEAALLAA